MKKASGLLLLLLVGLLVALPVAAFAMTADNGAFALTFDGTKINVQEEVGGTYLHAAENMAALAVEQNAAGAVSIQSEASVTNASHYSYGHDMTAYLRSYKPTPGAGGDGFARSIQRLIA